VNILAVDGCYEGGRQLAENDPVDDIPLGLESVDHLAPLLQLAEFLSNFMEHCGRIHNNAVLLAEQLEKFGDLGKILMDMATP
jgi:hypothetical protein